MSFSGTVIFWRDNEDGIRGYGFIAPLNAIDRSENVWFGLKETSGVHFHSFDRVEYELSEFARKDKGPRARLVWPAKTFDEVTTLPGEN